VPPVALYSTSASPLSPCLTHPRARHRRRQPDQGVGRAHVQALELLLLLQPCQQHGHQPAGAASRGLWQQSAGGCWAPGMRWSCVVAPAWV